MSRLTLTNAGLWRDLRKTVGLIWRSDPKMSLVSVALTVLQALTPVAGLYIGKLLIDAIAKAVSGGFATPLEAWYTLLNLVLWQMGISTVAIIVAYSVNATMEMLGDSLKKHTSEWILSKAARLSIPNFENPDVNNTLKNAIQEVGIRPFSLLNQLLTFVQIVVTTVGLGAVMYNLGGTIMLLLLLAALPVGFVSYHFNKLSLKMDLAFTESERVQDYLSGVLTSEILAKEVRLFGLADHFIGRWRHHHMLYRQAYFKLLRNRTVGQTLSNVVSTVFAAVATLLVALRAIQQTITIGDFTFLSGAIFQVQGQFTSLVTILAKLHENLIYMRQVFDFIALENRDPDQGEVWSEPVMSIEFRSVSFSYPLVDQPVLDDISFFVTQGQLLALVGENGAGKSTLIKLLTRLYEPTKGTILFNGKNVSVYSSASLQKQVSAIFQDFGQYHVSVAENIHAGGEHSSASLRKAVELAGASRFTDTFNERLDSVLGRTFTGGLQLSGGQWQRVALARLYHKPSSVWILDEPTAALDAFAESEVLDSIRDQGHDKISILISHRMSSARRAQQIIVLGQGRVIENGTHEELLRQDGYYARMYNSQARGYEDLRSHLPSVHGYTSGGERGAAF